MRGLRHWPQHRLSFGVASAWAFLAVLSATDGTVGWEFWGLLVATGGWTAIGERERRREKARRTRRPAPVSETGLHTADE